MRPNASVTCVALATLCIPPAITAALQPPVSKRHSRLTEPSQKSPSPKPQFNVLFACHVARSTPNQRVPVQHYIVKTQTRETVLVLQPTLPSQSCCIRLPQKMNYTQNGNLAQRSLTTPVLQNENETNTHRPPARLVIPPPTLA